MYLLRDDLRLQATTLILRFADIEIDTNQYELCSGGKRIDVEPLVFDLLVHFGKHANTLFRRDNLMAAVWGGRVVSDATISGCIKSARKVQGDSGDKQLYIKTVHGRGFRVIGYISQDKPQSDPLILFLILSRHHCPDYYCAA